MHRAPPSPSPVGSRHNESRRCRLLAQRRRLASRDCESCHRKACCRRFVASICYVVDAKSCGAPLKATRLWIVVVEMKLWKLESVCVVVETHDVELATGCGHSLPACKNRRRNFTANLSSNDHVIACFPFK